MSVLTMLVRGCTAYAGKQGRRISTVCRVKQKCPHAPRPYDRAPSFKPRQ